MTDPHPTRPSDPPRRRKRLKWEPWALMLLVMGLGMYLIWSPISGLKGPRPAPGTRAIELRVGGQRGIVEVDDRAAAPAFRVLLRNGYESPIMDARAFASMFGEESLRAATRTESPLFRVLNITSWTGLVWVLLGFAGQLAFTGRMLVQWLVSERKKASVIPEVFWWMSLIGGVLLFTYFVWRQDFIGVLGQSSGVVIYARNLRLIHKKRRRAAARPDPERSAEGVSTDISAS
ncbi:MAG: lipid-A-disaccharide synthase N-terminal domain-containing protein [Planctomycetota bacterium]|nr:lipid-A-disaccharide synthase N-terminal domain-containing protein [Planctomycetota bacterium]